MKNTNLGGTSDHVLDEVTVSWGVNDGDVKLVCFELPQGNVDGNTTLTLGLELVHNPRVFERSFAHLQLQQKFINLKHMCLNDTYVLSFLLVLFNGTLVDTSALVDQVSGGSGFTRVDMANDDDVNVCLFLSHV